MTPSLYFQVSPPYIWATQITALAMSDASYNVSHMGSTVCPRQDGTPRSTPTYYPRLHVYVCCQFTTARWGVRHFYQKLRLCSCGTKPQHSRNHWYL